MWSHFHSGGSNLLTFSDRSGLLYDQYKKVPGLEEGNWLFNRQRVQLTKDRSAVGEQICTVP